MILKYWVKNMTFLEHSSFSGQDRDYRIQNDSSLSVSVGQFSR